MEKRQTDIQAMQAAQRAMLSRNKKGILKFFDDVFTSRTHLLMLLPGVAFLLIFAYLPMIGTLIAFKDMKFGGSNIFINFANSPWVGFKNFEFFLKTPYAWIITRNTVGYNIIFIILGLILAVTFAIMLNEVISKKAAKFYQTSMMLPNFLSWVVVSYIVYAFLNEQYGIMNRVVYPLVAKEGPMWYSEPGYWPYIFVFLNCWKSVGYNAVIYIAAIAAIAPEFYEAAYIDGASKWKQIKYITIPHLIPLMTILTILAVGNIFKGNFGLFYFTTLQTGPLKEVYEVLDTYVFDTFRITGDIGMSSAAGLYQSVVGFILVLVANYSVSKIDKDNALF